MSDATVHVSGLSPTTTDASLSSFLSFCGKIASVDRNEKTATVVFEKASAARTSLMLDGGTLDGATIHVQAPSAGGSSSAAVGASPLIGGGAAGDEVAQEDKPRTAIAAEYLAHGYVIGDKAISKAIELDSQHGISARFLSYFNQIDSKYAVTHKTTQAQADISTRTTAAQQGFTAKANELDVKTGASTKLADLDAKTGASSKISSLFSAGRAYYEKALSSPQGAKVREFYTTATKQAVDVHAEARRIAEEKAGHPLGGYSSRRGSVNAPIVEPTGTVPPTGSAPVSEAAPVSVAPNVSSTPAVAPSGAPAGAPTST